jgi:hypothetical protein
MRKGFPYKPAILLLIFLSGESGLFGQINYSTDKLSNLGISLFDGKSKELLEPSVCDFIERLMLELILLPNDKQVVRKLNEYKINIQYNGTDFGVRKESFSSLLKKSSLFPAFTLQKTQKKYTAIWKSQQGDLFTITFPAERELIEGTSKREADETLSRLLVDYACETNRVSEPIRFFSSEDNDENYSLETMSNLFYGYINNDNLKLKLNYRSQNTIPPETIISLNDFLCFFRNNFEFYCNVKDKGQNHFEITLILYHRDFNYIHMLLIKSTQETISEEERILDADFYSNISQYNLNNNSEKIIIN